MPTPGRYPRFQRPLVSGWGFSIGWRTNTPDPTPASRASLTQPPPKAFSLTLQPRWWMICWRPWETCAVMKQSTPKCISWGRSYTLPYFCTDEPKFSYCPWHMWTYEKMWNGGRIMDRSFRSYRSSEQGGAVPPHQEAGSWFINYFCIEEKPY
jgi:hypothetical protein